MSENLRGDFLTHTVYRTVVTLVESVTSTLAHVAMLEQRCYWCKKCSYTYNWTSYLACWLRNVYVTFERKKPAIKYWNYKTVTLLLLSVKNHTVTLKCFNPERISYWNLYKTANAVNTIQPDGSLSGAVLTSHGSVWCVNVVNCVQKGVKCAPGEAGLGNQVLVNGHCSLYYLWSVGVFALEVCVAVVSLRYIKRLWESWRAIRDVSGPYTLP